MIIHVVYLLIVVHNFLPLNGLSEKQCNDHAIVSCLNQENPSQVEKTSDMCCRLLGTRECLQILYQNGCEEVETFITNINESLIDNECPPNFVSIENCGVHVTPPSISTVLLCLSGFFTVVFAIFFFLRCLETRFLIF